MRLYRILLENYRGVRHSEVVFDTDGVTVVHGPNEIGKSSLIEALDLMLRFPATTTHREVQAVRPKGGTEDPVTEIEVGVGGYRLRYRKVWRKASGRTVLDVLEPAEHRDQHEGTEAHDRFAALLGECGVDLDLWKLLRVNQDRPLGQESKEEPHGQPVGFAARPAIAAALAAGAERAEAGGRAGSGPQERLFAAVEREYLAYFTPETAKPTGGYRKAMDELDEANAREGEAKQVLAEAQDKLDALERVTARLEGEEAELAELTADVEQLTGQLSEAVAVRDRLRALTARLELAQQAAEAAAEVALRADRLAQEQAALAEVDELTRTATQDHRRLEDELAALEAGGRPSAEALRLAEADLACLRDREALDRLDAAVAAAADAKGRLDDAEAELAGNRVDKAALAGVEAAFQAWDRAAAALDAHAATVRVERLGDAPVQVAAAHGNPAGAAARSEAAASGAPDGGELIRLVDTVTVEAPGVVRVVVAPGSGEQSRREKERSTRAAYEKACGDAAVADLAAARAAHEAHEAAVARRSVAQAELRAALGGVRDHGTDLAEIRERAERLRASVSVALAGRPAAAAAPPASIDEAAAALTRAQVAVAEHEARLKAATGDAASADKEASRLRERLSSLERSVGNAQEEVKRAQAALDRLPAVEPAEELDRARAEHEQAQTRLAGLNPLQLESVLDNKSRVRHQLETDCQHHRVLRAELRAAIAQFGERGPQETAERAAIRVAQARHTFDVLQERAEAARLLRETLTRHRSEQRARYAAPFRLLVENWAAAVFGNEVSLDVGEDLTVKSKTSRGATVPFTSLSTGAREQLALLGRIACAQLVAPGSGGVPLILDDTLGHSDRRRIDQIAAILDRVAGTGMQVIILTHAPERFRIASAARVDLSIA